MLLFNSCILYFFDIINPLNLINEISKTKKHSIILLFLMLTEDVVFYSIATTILFIYVVYLIWEYSAKDVPLYIKILTFISWILTFSIVLVLPIDIANVII